MARLLEIAARNADELMAEAKAEAEQLTSTARAEAERLLSEARSRGGDELRAESEEGAGPRPTGTIAELRQTEREHRERMKSHLEEMLAKVEANSIGLTRSAEASRWPRHGDSGIPGTCEAQYHTLADKYTSDRCGGHHRLFVSRARRRHTCRR